MGVMPQPSQSMETDRNKSREFPTQPNSREFSAQLILLDSRGDNGS